jgi:hypothetical protein
VPFPEMSEFLHQMIARNTNSSQNNIILFFAYDKLFIRVRGKRQQKSEEHSAAERLPAV